MMENYPSSLASDGNTSGVCYQYIVTQFSHWNWAPSVFCSYLLHMASFVAFFPFLSHFPTLLSVLPRITLQITTFIKFMFQNLLLGKSQFIIGGNRRGLSIQALRIGLWNWITDGQMVTNTLFQVVPGVMIIPGMLSHQNYLNSHL